MFNDLTGNNQKAIDGSAIPQFFAPKITQSIDFNINQISYITT
jgi:hypothetical protein